MTALMLENLPCKQLAARARDGDGDAACVIGDRYRLGEVVQQDWRRAYRWYRVGARLAARTHKIISVQFYCASWDVGN